MLKNFKFKRYILTFTKIVIELKSFHIDETYELHARMIFSNFDIAKVAIIPKII